MASYGSLYDSSYKPTGSNFLEQAFTPIKQTLVDAYNTPRNPGLPYSYKAPVGAQNNFQSVLTTPQARNYDPATGRLRVQPQVDPLQLQQFFKGQSQEAVGNLGTVLPNFDSSFVRNAPIIGPDNIPYLGSRMDNAPLEGYPYRGEFYNENTFTQVGQPTGVPSAVVAPTQKEFSLSPAVQQQVQQPQQQPVQVRAATADVQPTTSQPISPIGVQSVTEAMNAQPTVGNIIPQAANTDGWFGTAKSWLGDKFGVDATQYLTNPDGTIMMSKEGVPMVNADATSWDDVGAGLMGTAQIGLGAYSMFTGMDQNQHALDTQRGQLNLMREKYAEDKRKNQAIVAQNLGA